MTGSAVSVLLFLLFVISGSNLYLFNLLSGRVEELRETMLRVRDQVRI